ncbi:hypothetical protein TNIN_207681 [Trichonephila inaurata madagascariensis]|uniref:Uncharacterized protein n=1 Tax=Trichonephila inaurata madagascariensis TaxID=2747483 RepID=A0A8X6XXK3_9ARAC|nr:hypothetical protein TNIN_207681 [Trichonephila inaurata madagascariensis]
MEQKMRTKICLPVWVGYLVDACKVLSDVIFLAKGTEHLPKEESVSGRSISSVYIEGPPLSRRPFHYAHLRTAGEGVESAFNLLVLRSLLVLEAALFSPSMTSAQNIK